MLSILIPAARRATPETAQTCWGDLRVALASIAAYAPGIDVVVGWNGLEEPRDLPPNPCARLLRQAPGITTASDAWNWCATQTTADELLIVGDDVVLHPDTLRLLLEDVATIRRERPQQKLGFVGARSNFVKGAQNIRAPNGGQLPPNQMAWTSEASIIEVPMVVPIAAWVEHRVLDEAGGFPGTNWFADDIVCWDLRHRGYVHYVSRAYVHHVGERSTTETAGNQQKLLEQGLRWIRANRPDYWAEMVKTMGAGGSR